MAKLTKSNIKKGMELRIKGMCGLVKVVGIGTTKNGGASVSVEGSAHTARETKKGTKRIRIPIKYNGLTMALLNKKFAMKGKTND